MKLIAIDMDGTLLSHTLHISDENLEAIKMAEQEGHVVMICSGRAKDDIEQVLRRYNISFPLGASNGAVVYVSGQQLEAAYIQKKTVLQLVQLLENADVPYKFYTNKGIYAPKDWQEQVRTAFHTSETLTHSVTLNDIERVTEQQLQSNIITFFDHVYELLSSDEIEIEKFFIVTLDQQRRERLLQQLQGEPHIMITSSAPSNLEIMDENGHKGNGLQVMAKHFGIPIEDTIAIGDNFNDVPMLKAAGFSIAMGNAEQEVKDMCHAVTHSNEEHGVAHAIRTYILGQTKQQ